MVKYFFITVDTEGDNLWKWKCGDPILTENANYLSRFQNLCNDYGFKPVWLTDWEMLNDPLFIRFAKEEASKGNCEVGMHLHPWNNPPFFELEMEYPYNVPYLIEYPIDIMEEKIVEYISLYKNIFGKSPVSHRAGRWAMNKDYFMLLNKYGISIDCSVTPGIDWSSSRGQTINGVGANYTKASHKISIINGVMEIPMTVKGIHCIEKSLNNSIFAHVLSCVKYIKKRNIMFRPNGRNFLELEKIVKQGITDGSEYLMFMIHSSELMPGGSPTFVTEKDIESLYDDLNKLFRLISKSFEGCTFEEYLIKQEIK